MAPCITPRRCHTAEAVVVTCGLACRARDASGGKRLVTQAKNMGSPYPPGGEKFRDAFVQKANLMAISE